MPLLAAVAALAVAALSGCSGGSPTVDRPAKPAVSNVSPATASVVQTRTVTIAGHDLQNVTAVRFGTQTAAVKKATDSRLTVSAPAAAAYQPAKVDVTLLNKKGAAVASKSDAYRYTAGGGIAAQMRYALAHWKDYNTSEYGDLNPVGGDCANFASQTLIARGWTMNDDWYNHDAAASWSPSWGYVPAFDDYFAANASKYGFQKLSFSQADRAKVSLGDIGVFEWANDGYRDHIEVVDKITHVNGTIKISFASHNDDYEYRDLDETITKQHPGAGGHIWHLTRVAGP